MASSAVKSKIGVEDQKLWDGLDRTYTRQTSTGGSLTLNKIGNVVDVLNVYGSGTSFSSTTLKTAFDQIGASNYCIVQLTPGSWTITEDLTVPSNITLDFPRGATIGGAFTLTMAEPPRAGQYQIFEDDITVVFSQGVELLVDWWGTTSARIQRAMTSCQQYNGVKILFSPGTSYTIDATVLVSNPGHYWTVYAQDALFTGSLDDAWFHIHEPAVHEPTNIGHFLTAFSWIGGHFVNSASTLTASECIHVENNRRGYFTRMYIENFWKGYSEIKSENVAVFKNYFYKCVYSVWSGTNNVAADNTQNLTIEGNLISNPASIGTAEAGIAIMDRCQGLKIFGNTFSVDTQYGTHAIIYVVDQDAGSSGVVPAHAHRIRDNHFEQYAGTCIWYDDVSSIGFKTICIEDNSFSSVSAGTFTNIVLENVTDGFILRNYMYGSATPVITGVSCDANCVRINCDQPGKNNWSGINTTFSLACARSELNILPPTWDCMQILTGYANTAKSTMTETIDVWGLLDAVHKYDGVVPKGYWVTVQARDSGSLAGTTSITLKKNSAASSVSGIYINLAGLPNDSLMNRTSYIQCETDGSLYVSIVASGTLTCDVTIIIKQIVR